MFIWTLTNGRAAVQSSKLVDHFFADYDQEAGFGNG
jgi:hypothetical protein